MVLPKHQLRGQDISGLDPHVFSCPDPGHVTKRSPSTFLPK